MRPGPEPAAAARSLDEHPGAEAFRRAFHDEHVFEAGFLLDYRLSYLTDPTVPWRATADVEARVARHLEALHVGGAGAARALEAALSSDEEDALRGASHAAAALAETDEALDPVIRALSGAEPDKLPFVTEGLRHACSERLAPRLEALLAGERAETRAACATILGYNRAGSFQAIRPLLDDDAPAVQVAAAHALAAMDPEGARDHVGRIARETSHPCAGELLLAWFLTGDAEAPRFALRAADEPGQLRVAALFVLALDGALDYSANVRSLISDPEGGLAAITAAGILGDGALVEPLLAQLATEDPVRSAHAAMALNTITGADLAEEMVELDVEDGDPAGTVRRAVAKLSVDEPRWRSWWDENEGAFSAATRWRRGKGLDRAAILDELAAPLTPLADRRRAGYELRSTGVARDFECDAFIARQERVLREVARPSDDASIA